MEKVAINLYVNQDKRLSLELIKIIGSLNSDVLKDIIVYIQFTKFLRNSPKILVILEYLFSHNTTDGY